MEEATKRLIEKRFDGAIKKIQNSRGVKKIGGAHKKVTEKSGIAYSKTKNRLGAVFSSSFKIDSPEGPVEVTLANLVVIFLVLWIIAGSLDPNLTAFLVKTPKPPPQSAPMISAPPSPSPSSSPGPSQGSVPGPAPPPPPAAPTPPPNFGGIPQKLSSAPMIQDFPSNAVVLLRFFSFDTGQREWQKDYTITGGAISEGQTGTPDATVVIHSKYVNRIYNEDFCNVVKDAKRNGDLAMESDLNTFSLTWKFRSLMQHKDCVM